MATLLFDLDGTLTDSGLGITRCIKHALDQMQVSYDKTRDFFSFVGPPLSQSFAVILNTNDAALIDTAVGLYRDRFAAIGMFENSVYPGVLQAVKGLAQNHQLYVVTSKPEVYAEKIVEHFGLGQYFKQVYGTSLSGSTQSKVELLANVLKQIDYQAGETYMIGDRRFDIEAGRAHKLNTIGVKWGYGSVGELKKAQSGTIVSNVDDMLAYLSSHNIQSATV